MSVDQVFSHIKWAEWISDKNGAAVPADWPNNSLIKDRVIIPPAKTMKDAEERLKQYEGYDWWFCHKSL